MRNLKRNLRVSCVVLQMEYQRSTSLVKLLREWGSMIHSSLANGECSCCCLQRWNNVLVCQLVFKSLYRYLEWGRAWSFLEGEDSSQTQYASSDDGVQVFNHPIDVHFASASIQGWPRMVVQAWELDEFGRSILAGYGFVHMPTNPGE